MIKSLTQFFLLIFSATTIFAVVSCASEDSGAPKPNSAPTKTNKELLTINNWVRTGLTINDDDVFIDVQDCEKDGTDKFFENGNFIYNNGALKCDSAEPQTIALKWEFTNAEQTIVKRSDGYTFTIKELTETKLVYEQTDSSGDVYASTFKAVPSYTKLITNANGWKLTGVTLYGKSYIHTFAQCKIDNNLKFKTDFRYIEDEGATKCDPTDPQEIKSTWKFTDNETTLEANSRKYLMIDLSETTLIYTDNYLVYTYTAQ